MTILVGLEDNRGHDVSRDLDSHSIVGRSGNSKLRLLDSALKPKKISEAPSGSKHATKQECLLLHLFVMLMNTP